MLNKCHCVNDNDHSNKTNYKVPSHGSLKKGIIQKLGFLFSIVLGCGKLKTVSQNVF